jgi:hypothetical protein
VTPALAEDVPLTPKDAMASVRDLPSYKADPNINKAFRATVTRASHQIAADYEEFFQEENDDYKKMSVTMQRE